MIRFSFLSHLPYLIILGVHKPMSHSTHASHILHRSHLFSSNFMSFTLIFSSSTRFYLQRIRFHLSHIRGLYLELRPIRVREEEMDRGLKCSGLFSRSKFPSDNSKRIYLGSHNGLSRFGFWDRPPESDLYPQHPVKANPQASPSKYSPRATECLWLAFHFGQINCPPLNKKGDKSRISCYFDAGNSLDHCFR